jgi:hypothetical protein
LCASLGTNRGTGSVTLQGWQWFSFPNSAQSRALPQLPFYSLGSCVSPRPRPDIVAPKSAQSF